MSCKGQWKYPTVLHRVFIVSHCCSAKGTQCTPLLFCKGYSKCPSTVLQLVIKVPPNVLQRVIKIPHCCHAKHLKYPTDVCKGQLKYPPVALQKTKDNTAVLQMEIKVRHCWHAKDNQSTPLMSCIWQWRYPTVVLRRAIKVRLLQRAKYTAHVWPRPTKDS